MKINLPVTQTEKPWVANHGYIVSKTDCKGIITYVNDAFVEMSGFSREELLGQSHNIVRHPDMPPQAFENLWITAKTGRPWTGIVKNRCKNGDYYWVSAFVVPIHQDREIVGYMSVRTPPSQEQVSQAEALYRQLNQTKAKISLPGFFKRLTIRARLAGVMGFMAALMLTGGIISSVGMMLTNDALEAQYKARLEPTRMIGQIMLLMNDNRSQVSRGLEHDPQDPHAKDQDHPLTAHTDAILKKQNEVAAIWQEYLARDLSPQEKALAERYAAARGQYVEEGLKPAREALLAGDYGQADRLLREKVDPLYEAARIEAEALLQQTLNNAREEYQAASQRYVLIRNLAIGGTLAGLLLALAAAVSMMRSIVRPLNQANEQFGRISQGDLTGEIDISRQDETGQVLSGIAIMKTHLQVMVDEIRETAVIMEARCNDLNSQIQQIANHSLLQHDEAQEVAAALEEVSQSIAEVAEAAAGTASAAENSAAIVSGGNAQMEKSMVSTGRMVEAVQTSSGTISDLNQSIQKIDDITHAIKEIADQTNLLALNAAIEAARAGEQGRGFAVVADEVRKLAERTSVSTTDISNTVTEIQAATSSAVTSMDQAVVEVEEAIDLMKASSHSLRQVAQNSDQVGDVVTSMAQHIANATKQQSIATETVAVNMEKISGLIEENTVAAQHATGDTEDLTRAASNLLAVVHRFKI